MELRILGLDSAALMLKFHEEAPLLLYGMTRTALTIIILSAASSIPTLKAAFRRIFYRP